MGDKTQKNIEDIVNSVGKTPLVKLDKLFDKEKEILQI